MIPVVFSNPKNKKFAKVLVIFFLLFVGGNLFFAPSARAGADAISSINSIAVESPALYDGGTIGKCQVMLNIAKAVPCLPAGVTLNCKEHDDAIGVAGAQCTKDATDDAQKKQVLALIAEAKTKDKAREVLAFAIKSALKTFSRQVAHDTAVWVASGGKGQQPLFITEGWGAYLQNTADSALGQFIDGIGTQYGVNLCQPDFRVKLMIQTALNYKQVQKSTSCSFSKIMTNWEGAISSASFAVDYRNAMRPGANDISFMIQMADERNSYVGDAVNVATKKAETTGLWKDITNVAGKILTPGTVVANTFRDKTADSNTTLGLSTFTNTAADMVEEFGNTLVSQLLSGLQTGLFASTNSGGSTGANSNPLGLNASDAVDTLVNLFNYNSSPVVSGAAGAENKFANLITSKEKVGNKYDVLLKLASCSDSAKLNPNVTDCVIDNSFSEQIKKMTYVKDLPSDSNGTNILGRAFAPIISQTNSLETEIPYRSILILRKYRIVPVGWEIAANKIHNNEVTTTAGVSAKRWTLGEVMNCYYGQGINNCNTDAFKGLVNPNWLLKVYEAFCRREGFGAHNSAGNNQTGDIARDTYCADEQQCLADDSKGNCKAYGYCSEERALWDVGNSCQAAYNTCQTYSGRSGTAGSLLKNSLDFSNCSNLNVGCQALTTNFNLAGAIWNGEFLNEAKDLQLYALSSGAQVLTVGGDASWKVKQYHNASVNNRLKITQTCTPELCSGVDSKCNWEASTKTCNFNKSGNTCTTAPSAVSCLVEACYEQGNVIGGTGFNNGFEESATAGDARYWSDELAYFNLSNRAYRATDQKHSGNASLHTVASNNPVELVTKLENVPLDKNNANYSLKFWAKGSVTAGLLKINVLSGSDDLAGISYTLAGSLEIGRAHV